MLDGGFNLEQYLTQGAENIVKGALKASFSNPKESVFMTKYALASKKASRLRHEAEQAGDHIPPFLIASVTSSCNLHCADCYSRAIDSCNDVATVEQLDGHAWGKIFREAGDLGISFIFLAGGEPLLRKDVVKEAADIPDILFPVITNGTLLDDEYMDVFDQNRNLVPVISIEGWETTTDKRRGSGVYMSLDKTMERLKERDIIFGASVTVTTENVQEVMSQEFVSGLYQAGCKLVIYIEFVPVTEDAVCLAPGDEERSYMEERLLQLRGDHEDMVFVAFPGDEKAYGGCLATGRGFFHINSHGGAEPCPFSPYSDLNVKEVGIAGALRSELFRTLQESGMLTEEHNGGCVLHQEDARVRELMDRIPK